jgi:hypothetical protein
VKAFRPRGRHALECRGEDVLAGMLLHVLETPRPIDPSVDWSRSRWLRRTPFQSARFEHVDDRAVVSIHHVDDRRVSQAAGIERLPSRGRVERRPIEHHGGPPLVRLGSKDARVELCRVRVDVIETFGHGRDLPAWPAGSTRPASSKPRARRRQLSHSPQGRPSGPGS